MDAGLLYQWRTQREIRRVQTPPIEHTWRKISVSQTVAQIVLKLPIQCYCRLNIKWIMFTILYSCSWYWYCFLKILSSVGLTLTPYIVKFCVRHYFLRFAAKNAFWFSNEFSSYFIFSSVPMYSMQMLMINFANCYVLCQWNSTVMCALSPPITLIEPWAYWLIATKHAFFFCILSSAVMMWLLVVCLREYFIFLSVLSWIVVCLHLNSANVFPSTFYSHRCTFSKNFL